MVLRTGTRGWKRSANRRAKNTPSAKCEISPAKYVAPATGPGAPTGRPRISSPLNFGQFRLGSPNPGNQMPNTVANWGAPTPASREPPIGCLATQARQRGSVSSVGIRTMNPGLLGVAGLLSALTVLTAKPPRFTGHLPVNCPNCVPRKGCRQYLEWFAG